MRRNVTSRMFYVSRVTGPDPGARPGVASQPMGRSMRGQCEEVWVAGGLHGPQIKPAAIATDSNGNARIPIVVAETDSLLLSRRTSGSDPSCVIIHLQQMKNTCERATRVRAYNLLSGAGPHVCRIGSFPAEVRSRQQSGTEGGGL